MEKKSGNRYFSSCHPPLVKNLVQVLEMEKKSGNRYFSSCHPPLVKNLVQVLVITFSFSKCCFTTQQKGEEKTLKVLWN